MLQWNSKVTAVVALLALIVLAMVAGKLGLQLLNFSW